MKLLKDSVLVVVFLLAGAVKSPALETTRLLLLPGKANAIIFAPTEGKYVRLAVSNSISGDQPCLDEVEVFARDGTNNLALAGVGAKVTASSCLAGYANHKVEHLNDGLYGNQHSWIAAGRDGWVQIELAQTAAVARVVVSRDRTGAFVDRMPTVIRVDLSEDGRNWRQVALVTSPEPPSKMPPPSTPVTTFSEAVKWLEGEAHRIIRASAVPMNDSTLAFPPQVGIGYDAFWLRDYEYALEGSIQSFSDKELTDACRVFVDAIRADGAAVDCVRFGGIPVYKPGYGSMGREPVLDGPPFTVGVAWRTYQRTKDQVLLRSILDLLVKTMDYMPRNPTNGLAHIKFPGERCPYGFTDSISKSGDELFCSLLMVQGSRQLCDLLETAGRTGEARKWRREAERIAENIRTVFWDAQSGLFRSTTGACNVPDIWGSAFAVRLGVATSVQAQRVAKYYQEHYDELVLHGQVRHMPGFMDWNGRKTVANSGQYQSGGFWATPVGWFVYTLDLADPSLADKTVIEMVRHFQTRGACEWINREGTCQLPGYTASTALPLDGIRAMLERRTKRERLGSITSWARAGGGLHIKCGERVTVTIDVLADGIFRTRCSVDDQFPAARLLEAWRLVKPNDQYAPVGLNIREEQNQIMLTTGLLRLKLERSPFRISVFDRNDRLLTRQSAGAGMEVGNSAYLQMEKATDEHFFGLGQGIGTLNPKAPFREYRYAEYRNVCIHGTQLDQSVITLDQTGKRTFFCLGPNWSGQCMAPAVIPFFMSTKGYGFYLNDFRDSVFDLGNTQSNAWSITLGGEPNYVPHAGALDFYFIYGPSLAAILGGYTDITGKTPMLPRWSLGYLQICNFEQKQDEVVSIARGFRQRDIPCDMLLLEPGWMKTPYRMDGWSPNRFPDPAGMIADLRRLHFRLGLWQCGPADWVFTSWDLLKRHVNQWGADITNPVEVDNYKRFHLPYYDQGISFFKQDGCGQSEWQPDVRYHNGLTGREMHNIIPTLYSQVMYEAYKEHTGRRTINFNPMVGPSQQRYPGIWPSGDAGGGYEHFKGEMNLGLSGHTYTTHDFTDRSPAGIHWSLLGPFCPGALSAFPEGPMCQFYLKLRCQLVPYIYSTHWQAHLTGVPYMRAMVLDYQHDPMSYRLDRQCLLGDWLLLAAYTKDVYLPAGKWTDYWSGETFVSKGEWRRGCRWPATVGGALFVKGGAIIPMSPVVAFADKEPLEIVQLDIYPDGGSKVVLYEDDGETFDYENGASAITEFRCRETAGEILIAIGARNGHYLNMPANRSYLLGVHCQTEPVKVLKGTKSLARYQTKNALVTEGANHGWHYDNQRGILWVKPMPGWRYVADERGVGDPEKDSAQWMDSEKHEEGAYALLIQRLE